MFPFTSKHLSQAKLYLREAAKLVAYRKDISPGEVIAEVESEIQALQALVSAKAASAPVEAQMQRLELGEGQRGEDKVALLDGAREVHLRGGGGG